MERPTKKIQLPISGKEAEIVSYFTRGEKQEIQKILYSSAKMSQGAEGKGSNIDFSMVSALDSKNKALELAVKNMSIDEINNLPDEDADLIEVEVDKISQPKKK